MYTICWIWDSTADMTFYNQLGVIMPTGNSFICISKKYSVRCFIFLDIGDLCLSLDHCHEKIKFQNMKQYSLSEFGAKKPQKGMMT